MHTTSSRRPSLLSSEYACKKILRAASTFPTEYSYFAKEIQTWRGGLLATKSSLEPRIPSHAVFDPATYDTGFAFSQPRLVRFQNLCKLSTPAQAYPATVDQWRCYKWHAHAQTPPKIFPSQQSRTRHCSYWVTAQATFHKLCDTDQCFPTISKLSKQQVVKTGRMTGREDREHNR